VLALPPTWVLLDYALPGGVTGLVVAEWLREHYPAVRRILYTGAEPEYWLAHLRATDFGDPLLHAVVRKPSPVPQLVAAIMGS
jgi:CheY-like chemotaxis protein